LHYPTLWYYLDWTEHEYDGPRSLGALVCFIENKLVLPCDPFSSGRGSALCSKGVRVYADMWAGRDNAELTAKVDRLMRMGVRSGRKGVAVERQ
jgi:hypothetical protein